LEFRRVLFRSLDSARGRRFGESGPVLRMNASVRPGNSGGPLLDDGARVIGVNSQIATAGVNGNVGVGFAVPSNTVREVVPRLEQGGRIARPYLGIATTDALGGSGAEVAEVKPGTPADRAGIQIGDVIVAIDGHPIRGSDDVGAAVATHKPGDKVTLDVLRNGDRRRLGATLGNRP